MAVLAMSGCKRAAKAGSSFDSFVKLTIFAWRHLLHRFLRRYQSW